MAETRTPSGKIYSDNGAYGESRQHNGDVNYNSTVNQYFSASTGSPEERQQSDQFNQISDGSVHKTLWNAAFEGQLPRVCRLLKNGNKEKFLDYKDEYELSVIHHAALGGHVDVVERLLEQGADINASSMLGTPLCLASLKSHARVVELLLQRRANLHEPTRLGTALHCAAYGGSQECMELLLKANANLDVAAGVVVPLFEYILHQYRKYEPLSSDETMDDVLDLRECTPALLAIWKGTDAISTLTLLGPQALTFQTDCGLVRDPASRFANKNIYGDFPASEDKYTCIMAAARRNDTALLEYILKILRASNSPLLTLELINKQDSNGVTALHIAAEGGNADIVRLLRANGAAIDVEDKKGATPLALAVKGEHVRCAEMMTEDVQADGRYRHFPADVVANHWIACSWLYL